MNDNITMHHDITTKLREQVTKLNDQLTEKNNVIMALEEEIESLVSNFNSCILVKLLLNFVVLDLALIPFFEIFAKIMSASTATKLIFFPKISSLQFSLRDSHILAQTHQTNPFAKKARQQTQTNKR